VTRDVEPYAIVGGVPARFIRRRFPDQVCDALLASRWWELEIDAVRSLDVNDIDDCLARIPHLLASRRDPEDFKVLEPPLT
jgi:hypothetical protein